MITVIGCNDLKGTFACVDNFLSGSLEFCYKAVGFDTVEVTVIFVKATRIGAVCKHKVVNGVFIGS